MNAFRIVINHIKGKLLSFRHFNHIKGKVICDGVVKVRFGKGAYINTKGKLSLGFNSVGNNGRSSLIRLGNNSVMTTEGNTRIFFDGDIQLFNEAKLYIGDSFINSGCKLRITNDSHIGSGCAIGTDFTLLDSDFHRINGKIKSEAVYIADNVWIGTRVTVLSGVTIGEGSVIAAGSIVNSSVPAHSLVAGNPAKVIKSGIVWEI